MVPAHGAVAPVITPSEAGGDVEVTASVEAADVPQALVAVTVILPDEAAGVAVMDAVVLLPVHPVGSVHV